MIASILMKVRRMLRASFRPRISLDPYSQLDLYRLRLKAQARQLEMARD